MGQQFRWEFSIARPPSTPLQRAIQTLQTTALAARSESRQLRTATMSQQENGAPPRPSSNSYPEPHTYPSPQMQSSYTYPPPQGQPTNEPYRQSPTSSTMPPNTLNLPPIRGIDNQSQMPAQPPGQQAGPPLPPGQHMAAYPYVPPPGQPMIPGQVGSYPPQRYPLPAQNADARMMSGGRHKKEIKRRTKTGCLTCRKRRIKVSLSHFVSTQTCSQALGCDLLALS